ncbi:Os1348 family NHLP clan protein [Nostoc sp.]|uniref:Os1348 family NHLP clan protein n=1 Tax=Nostoc sp. TaxID=1180 RepID=UPI002FEFD2CF
MNPVITQVMDLWVADPEFSNQLRDDLEGAVASLGLELKTEELAMLRQIDWQINDTDLQARLNMDTGSGQWSYPGGWI